MRNFLTIMLILCLAFTAQAQQGNYVKSDTLPNFSLGIGTGLNSTTGMLGLSANIRVHNKLFLQGGAGLGMWGTKLTIGLKYDMKYGKGWSYGVGFSHCSGIKDLKLTINVPSGMQEVTMDFLPANTLNLKATHNWIIHKTNTFYIDMGYAIALPSTAWKVTDGSVLSSSSTDVINFLVPGGIIIGLGFTFGL